MSKKLLVILFIILCSFCLVNAVSASADENMTVANSNDEYLQVEEVDTLSEEDNEVLSHDTEYPWVEFYSPAAGDKISGIVDINLNVDSHSELRYANVTVENVNTKEVVFRAQDTNPSDGWGTFWDTSNAPNGKYFITAYVINVKDLSDEWSILVTLENKEKNTHILLNNAIGVVDQQTSLVAQLLDGNNNALANRQVEFTVGGETLTGKTGGDGVALVYYTPKEVKNYDVVVKFKGDNLYSPSQATMILKTLSNSNATIVTVNNVTGNNKENITLKANLKAPGFKEDSVNKQINFYVNNKLVGSSFTDNDGNAEFVYNVLEVGGKYAYYAEYTNASGETFKSYASLFVPESQLYITMTANKSNVKVGDTFKVTYNLFNLGPDNSTNVALTYTVVNSLKYIESFASMGNCTYDADSKEFKWIIDVVPVGNQTLNIIFQSTSVARNNLTASLTTDTYDKSAPYGAPVRYLTVKSYSKLSATDLVKYFSGPEKYVIYVYGDDGKLVGSDVSVKVTIGKTVFNLKTNRNGFVEVPITFNPGEYTSQVVCNGLSTSNKITVKSTIITKDLSKKKSKAVKFTAKLLNTNGKKLPGKKITFKIKGKTYKVKTNKKGIATLALKNLKVGKYTVSTSYGKLTVKNTIKIKK